MFRLCLVFAVCGMRVWCGDLEGKTVSAVIGAPAALALETKAGDPLNPAKLQRDVHKIWSTGRISDIQVEATPDGDAVRLNFRLKPTTTVRVRRVRVNQPTPGVRVELETGTDLDLRGAQQVATAVRKQL